MKRLLITAQLKANPVINDHLYLDGILYRAMRENVLGVNFYNLPRFSASQDDFRIRLPIKRKRGVYLASKAIYKIKVTYINKWRKRFQLMRAERWKDNKRFRIDSTYHKNYDMPIQVHILKDNKIQWVAIGEKDRIKRLLGTITSIGKKGAQGYGIVDRWMVEPTEKKGTRQFPVFHPDRLLDTDIPEHARAYPPYGHRKKQICVWRRF